jgi:hypothetical protein
VRVVLGRRSYEQLEHLADLADLPVNTEARLLLTWGIDLAMRRWDELSTADADDPEPPGVPPGWHQPLLPMVELDADEVRTALDELDLPPTKAELRRQ